jgi:hypothetical protein
MEVDEDDSPPASGSPKREEGDADNGGEVDEKPKKEKAAAKKDAPLPDVLHRCSFRNRVRNRICCGTVAEDAGLLDGEVSLVG